jgi:hypothetical protein
MNTEILKNNSTESQALTMAHDTGIELTPEQIARYVQVRLGNFSHQKREDLSGLFNLSDQGILDEILTPEQRPIFRLHYPNIFQLDTKSNAETTNTGGSHKDRIQLMTKRV